MDPRSSTSCPRTTSPRGRGGRGFGPARYAAGLVAALSLVDAAAPVAAASTIAAKDAASGRPGKEGGRVEGPDRLDELLDRIREEHRLPALAAAVVRGSEVVARGAVGVRKEGSPARVTDDDRWHLGSCTKAMTATLVARIVEEKKLSWQTTLERAFPELRGRMHPDFRGVTLEQLLAHRGGVPTDLTADAALWGKLRAFGNRGAAARKMLAAEVLSRAPERKPGEAYAYSNVGYVLAGAMAESATGRSWEDLMKGLVFEPLGMRSAGFGPPGGAGGVREPWGHETTGRSRTPRAPGPLADNPPALGPAGGVHATLDDWARFAALHIAGARGERTALLSADAFKKLHEPWPSQDYALGWIAVRRDWAKGVALTHQGSNTMWLATIWLAPERKLALLVATNCAGGDAEAATEKTIAAILDRLVEDAR